MPAGAAAAAVAVQCKPIPALYTVYILRSTVRHASLYIGSTPNPPRRLSQHNGLVRGGAARTSRHTLRPWEMVALVSGFPSATAALKFECVPLSLSLPPPPQIANLARSTRWALTNPHISMHIPSESRLAISTQRKANGRPRRPTKSVTSVVSNLHLLLRVPSFGRWPLRVHFFDREIFAAWEKWCAAASARLRASLAVVTDFGEPAAAAAAKSAASQEEEGPEPWGIHALPLDYEPIKDYVAKGQDIFEFERQGNCVVCQEAMVSGEGLFALCSNNGCDGVGHVSCWSRHLVKGEEPDSMVPIQGQCPKCKGEVQWGTMMKELTLRVRGQKDVEKLLKRKRKRATKKTAKA